MLENHLWENIKHGVCASSRSYPLCFKRNDEILIEKNSYIHLAAAQHIRMRKIACKLRSPAAEFQRNAVKLSRDTISIPRKPEPSSSLARTRDSREYVEFLSAMFVVSVHRSERARWRRDERTRALGTNRPTHFREMCQNTRMPDTTSFCGARAYVRVFTKVRRRAACGTTAALVVVAESIVDPETFSVRNARSLIQLRRTEFSSLLLSFSLSLSFTLCAWMYVSASDK